MEPREDVEERRGKGRGGEPHRYGMKSRRSSERGRKIYTSVAPKAGLVEQINTQMMFWLESFAWGLLPTSTPIRFASLVLTSSPHPLNETESRRNGR